MNGIETSAAGSVSLYGYLLGGVGYALGIFVPLGHVSPYVLLTLSPLLKISKIENRHKTKADSKYGRKITIHETSLLQDLS